MYRLFLSINITPSSDTTANIEIAIKQALPEGAPPSTVQFSSADTTIATLPTVAASDLVPSGTATLIANLLTKMSACYALPVADRVDTPDTINVPATAIKAAPCKEIFYNNDPVTFKSNGRVVGSNGAFANIFRTGGNNLVFDRGTYEFTRSNGDFVIGYRSTDSAGNVTNDTFAVRPDGAAAPVPRRSTLRSHCPARFISMKTARRMWYHACRASSNRSRRILGNK